MQAIVLTDDGLTFRRDYPRPVPGPDEALIRVRVAGICATDLEIVKGYVPFTGVLGHEFVGTVTESPDPDWVGKRVTGTINLGCGACTVCLASGPEHCPQRTVLGIHGKDGVFAEYVTLPLVNLRLITDAVPDEVAVFTEPLAAAVRIREQLPLPPTQRVAVVGPGRLGLLVSQVLALDGTEVLVLGRGEKSLELPRRLGLHTGLVDDFPDNAFDLVVEATGNSAGFVHALRLTRPLGTVVMKSTYAGNANVDLTKVVVGEITLIGSRCGPFAPALRLLEERAVEVRPLIAATYAFAQADDAFLQASMPGVRKILLHP